MGKGYTFRCRKCGYEVSADLGVGFMFPMVYQETMEAARAGEFGQTIQQFLEEHPDGVLNAENVFLQCTGCGNLGFGPDLSMYIRKPGVSSEKHGRWSVAFPFEGADYVSPMDLREEQNYEFIAWGHVCHECGKPMRPITQHDLETQLGQEREDLGRSDITCPKCKDPLWLESILMWD